MSEPNLEIVELSVGPNILERFKDNRSSNIYMLSEFIDNSIQSMIDHPDENQSIKVEITIDQVERQIIIKDNAYGIQRSDFARVISLHQDLKMGGLSRFGVGLKSAAFWYGRSLTILSKTKSDIAYKLKIDVDELIQKAKALSNKDDIWKIKPSIDENYNEVGTSVIINKVYDRRMKNSEKDWLGDEALSVLSLLKERYKYYLKSKELELVLRFKNRSLITQEVLNYQSIDEMHISLADYDSFPQGRGKYKYFDPFRFKVEDFNKIHNQDKSIYEEINKQQNLLSLKFEKFVGVEKKLYLKDIIQNIHEKRDLFFEFDYIVNPLVLEEKPIKIKFGFLNPQKAYPMKTFNGFALFQNKRAIVGGPNVLNNNELANNNKLRTNQMTKTNPLLRLYGEIFLDDEEVYPVDTNKSGFTDFDSLTFVEKIMNYLETEIKISDLCKYVSLIFNTQENMNIYNETPEESQSNIAKSLIEVSSDGEKKATTIHLDQKLDVINDVELSGSEFIIEERKYICIPTIASLPNDCFCDVALADDENNSRINVLVKINEKHKFWMNKITSDNKYLKFIKHGIGIVIASLYLNSLNDEDPYDILKSGADTILEKINLAFRWME